MKNLETKINNEIEKFQENNNAKIGDKFKMRSGKRIETIEIIDIVINLNSKLEIVHINFIAKMQKIYLLKKTLLTSLIQFLP